jgi:predicted flap endonuclease-1-like 5' DNA nuclease
MKIMTMNTPESRAACAQKLLAASARAATLTAFVGLDGFVDEILRVVDKRENAESYQPPAHHQPAGRTHRRRRRPQRQSRIGPQLTKLGGNGPIMANALAGLGLKVTYLGTRPSHPPSRLQ